MTSGSPTTPTMSVGRGVRAVVTTRSFALWLLAAIGWLVLVPWLYPDDARGTAVFVVMGVVVIATSFHRMVRSRRGLTGDHWSTPLIIFVGMMAAYLVINAVEPLVPTGMMWSLAGGSAVIWAVGSLIERYVERRRARSAGRGPATA